MGSALSNPSAADPIPASFRQNQVAATAIQYALIAALISIVIIGATTTIGTTLTATFTTISTAFANN
ncbi:MAG: Flp family type IVb pilin [Hyphomicrobiales bacterium]|nr:Flp family type IVb pilin [Hyphomicrobiales bacterium]MBV8426642.1 Flp family type IVb pilin [Hyphomicrobiales bacterium]